MSVLNLIYIVLFTHDFWLKITSNVILFKEKDWYFKMIDNNKINKFKKNYVYFAVIYNSMLRLVHII